MGATTSLSDQNNQLCEHLSREIQLYKSGEMDKQSLRYQLFLQSASKVIYLDDFYKELSIDQISEYIKTVQVFNKKEVSTIIKKLFEISDNDEEANSLIRRVLPNILCPCQKMKSVSYISPCCSESLFNDIVRRNPNLECGSYKPSNIFDFDSEEMIELKECQEKSIVQPKIQHSNDTALVIFANSLERIIGNENILDNNIQFFERPPMKPLLWEKNIHNAAKKGSIKSLLYDIYLLPILLNLQDENGQTPLHVASKSGQNSIIDALKEINANFNIYDNDGNLPIHVVKTRSVIQSLIKAGCSFDTPNKSGQTTIEIQSHPFNKEVISCLLRNGTNILLPNEKGQYWAQYVLFNSFFPSDNQYIEFHKFLRKNLSKTKHEFYSLNENVQKVISRNIERTMNLDYEELRNAVNNRDVDKIKTLLALGISPDTKIEDNTNLMIVSQRGDLELVKIFGDNFCDSNSINNEGENCFWLAAWNNQFEVASLLHKVYNANPDILSNEGQNILQKSYKEKREDVFQYLLDEGASPNIKNSNGLSLMFLLFMKREDELAEMVQDKYNGDINTKKKSGVSLGHYFIIKDDHDRLEYLLNRGLDINIKDDKNQSLLIYAMKFSFKKRTWQILIDNNISIDDQDEDGNTAFYLICDDPNFSKEKFNFLLNNNCNINIQNSAHDFPISSLIRRKRKEEALLLIDKKANIIDPKSPTEPICAALQAHDQFWFEKLVNCGANANNKSYPIIEKYIQEPFFNFEYFTALKPMNLFVGAPLQAAINTNKQQVAAYIWNSLSFEEKKVISRSFDVNHQTPLTVAIIKNNKQFFDVLISKGFDLTTPDNKGKTPLMHAILKNDPYFYNPIIERIPKKCLDDTDCKGDSVMTYAACLNNKELAKRLFLLGVEVESIHIDQYGIVMYYKNLERNYKNILSRIKDNHAYYINALKDARSYVNNSYRHENMNSFNMSIAKYNVLHNDYINNTEVDRNKKIYYDCRDDNYRIENQRRDLEKLIPQIESLAVNLYAALVSLQKCTRNDLLNSNYLEGFNAYIPRKEFNIPRL